MKKAKRIAALAGLILLTLGLPAFVWSVRRTPVGFGFRIPSVFAQAIYQQRCPTPLIPITGIGWQVSNLTNDKLLQWGCVDNRGNLSIGGTLYVAPSQDLGQILASDLPTGNGTVQLFSGTYTFANSSAFVPATMPNVSINGSGRNVTILQCSDPSKDCVIISGAKTTLRNVSIRYASQANVGTYAFRIQDSSEGTFENVTVDLNAYNCFLLSSSTATAFENHFIKLICRGFSNDGITAFGADASHLVLDTKFIDARVACTGSGTGIGIHISDFVQGWDTIKTDVVSCLQNLVIDASSNLNTFDIFFSGNTILDAVSGAANPVSINNVNDFRCTDCWIAGGSLMGNNHVILIGSGVTRSAIVDSYISGQESGTARIDTINSSAGSFDLKNITLIRGAVAPSSGFDIQLTASSTFNTIMGVTFNGSGVGAEISNAGSNNNIGPNYTLSVPGVYIGSDLHLPTSTFANLGTPTNGTIKFCSDCNATCAAGASTGRTCARENGAWVGF